MGFVLVVTERGERGDRGKEREVERGKEREVEMKGKILEKGW